MYLFAHLLWNMQFCFRKQQKTGIMNEVVISTSAVNSYGFRVLTEGIDTSQYERNPILLWMHNRPMRGTKDEVLPIGRVENLRKEGDKLIGSLVFDSADDFAKQIESKWQNGIIKMVSAGLEVISTDESPELMLPGQTGTTITKSKLKEVSVVDIGANDEALALYHKGEMLLLSDGNHKNIDFLTINKKQRKMKKIAIQLGLAEGATESEILAKVAGIQNENKTLKDAAEKVRKEAIVNLVATAQEAGKFGADKKEHFVKLGMEAGFESLKTTLECMHIPSKPSDFINPNSGDKKWETLSDVPAEELANLKESNPQEYARLYQKEYGITL